MKNSRLFVKASSFNSSLSSYERDIIITALRKICGSKKMQIQASQILHLLLWDKNDNYYEVVTIAGSFYVHRPTLKRAIAREKGL